MIVKLALGGSIRCQRARAFDCSPLSWTPSADHPLFNQLSWAGDGEHSGPPALIRTGCASLFGTLWGTRPSWIIYAWSILNAQSYTNMTIYSRIDYHLRRLWKCPRASQETYIPCFLWVIIVEKIRSNFVKSYLWSCLQPLFIKLQLQLQIAHFCVCASLRNVLTTTSWFGCNRGKTNLNIRR